MCPRYSSKHPVCVDCVRRTAREYYHQTKERTAARRRVYAIENRDKLSAANRRYRLANPEKVKAANAKSNRWDTLIFQRYGLTVEVYEAMFERQGRGCAICNTSKPGGRARRFHVDHDHRTGVIRGLLCNKCNTGLGLFSDDMARLHSAVAYLAVDRSNLPVPTKWTRTKAKIDECDAALGA